MKSLCYIQIHFQLFPAAHQENPIPTSGLATPVTSSVETSARGSSLECVVMRKGVIWFESAPEMSSIYWSVS